MCSGILSLRRAAVRRFREFHPPCHIGPLPVQPLVNDPAVSLIPRAELICVLQHDVRLRLPAHDTQHCLMLWRHGLLYAHPLVRLGEGRRSACPVSCSAAAAENKIFAERLLPEVLSELMIIVAIRADILSCTLFGFSTYPSHPFSPSRRATTYCPTPLSPHVL